MKGDKLFMVSIVMELVGLDGIIIAFPLQYIFPVLSAWIALICFIILCIGLVLSLVAFCMMVLE